MAGHKHENVLPPPVVDGHTGLWRARLYDSPPFHRQERLVVAVTGNTASSWKLSVPTVSIANPFEEKAGIFLVSLHYFPVMDANEDRSMHVALIGDYPPPYGGIPVHLQRLRARLIERGMPCTVYAEPAQGVTTGDPLGVIRPPQTKQWLFKYGVNARETLIHYHGSSWKWRIFLSSLAWRGKQVVFSLHNQLVQFEFERLPGVVQSVARRVITSDRIAFIATHPSIVELAVSCGVRPSQISMISPFIPAETSPTSVGLLPERVRAFLRDHQPRLAANASYLDFSWHDEDIYGLDLCVELVRALKLIYPKIGLVFCLSKIGDPDYFRMIQARITQYGIADNFLFVIGSLPEEACSIWQESHVFLRPTNTDGAALSVLEALSLGVPVVASNASLRPMGIVEFESRNVHDFVEKVRWVLSDFDAFKRKIEAVRIEDNFERILAVYCCLSGGNGYRTLSHQKNRFVPE